MATIGERLRGLVRRTVTRAAERAREAVAGAIRPAPPPAPSPAPPPKPPAPAKPPAAPAPPPPLPPLPAPPPGVGGPSEGQELLRRLSEAMATTNDIFRRLQQLGYAEAARAVLGAQPEPPAAPPPMPKPAAPPAGPPSVFPAPSTPGEEEEEEEPEPQRQAPETGEERYFLQGTGIAIGFHSDLHAAFGALNDLWTRASIGSLRNPDGTPKDPAPRYAPDAIVRGTAVDPGTRVPWEVWKNADRFVGWCESNGYGKGVSIEIDGLVAPPGRTIGPVGASARRGRK